MHRLSRQSSHWWRTITKTSVVQHIGKNSKVQKCVVVTAKKTRFDTNKLV